jgi:hypothetical protein
MWASATRVFRCTRTARRECIGLQRFLDQLLAAGVAQRRIFQLGDEAEDILDRDEPELVARAHGDAGPRAAAGAVGDARKLRARRPAGVRERLLEFFVVRPAGYPAACASIRQCGS